MKTLSQTYTKIWVGGWREHPEHNIKNIYVYLESKISSWSQNLSHYAQKLKLGFSELKCLPLMQFFRMEKRLSLL